MQPHFYTVALITTSEGDYVLFLIRHLSKRTIFRSDLKQDQVAPFEQEFQPLPLPPRHLLKQPTSYTTNHNIWPFPAPPSHYNT